MTSLRWIPALVFLAACAGLSQTHPVAKPASQKSTRVPATAKRVAISDADLEKTIRAKLARSKISADGFEVRVAGGVATLEGKTDVVQHKGVATRMAKTAGAVRVVNRIQISEAGRQKVAANLAKGRRRVQIKRGDARSEAR